MICNLTRILQSHHIIHFASGILLYYESLRHSSQLSGLNKAVEEQSLHIINLLVNMLSRKCFYKFVTSMALFTPAISASTAAAPPFQPVVYEDPSVLLLRSRDKAVFDDHRNLMPSEQSTYSKYKACTASKSPHRCIHRMEGESPVFCRLKLRCKCEPCFNASCARKMKNCGHFVEADSSY